MLKTILFSILIFMFLFFSFKSSWGQGVISLPQTGQTKCYNNIGAEIDCAGTGQDGDLQMGVGWPSPRFSVSGDCVTDNLTGLIWSKDADLPNGAKTWQGALDFAVSINAGEGLCGQTDWRVPNVNELETLMNAEADNSATWLTGQGFVKVRQNEYWSSTTFAEQPDFAWLVGTWGGYTEKLEKSAIRFVWLVRSGQLNDPDPSYPSNVWKTGQTTSDVAGDDGDYERGVSWPAPRFIDNGNETVTDKLTGLMWTKDANLRDQVTWQEALDYVKALNTGTGLGGHRDWRLPNRKELFSLIDYSRYSPALPADHPFQNVEDGFYWSSTTMAFYKQSAWIVRLRYGYAINCDKVNDSFLWPVRTGEEVFPPEMTGEGTIGTQITITGSGFGSKKGKVLIGSTALKVAKDGWTPTSITGEVKTPLSPGIAYDVVLYPKEPKGAAPIPLPGAFTMMAPEIGTVDPSGLPLEEKTLLGRFFGSKKGKVYLEDPETGKKQNCKVTFWSMHKTTGESELRFLVPKSTKAFLPGRYLLKISNQVGIDETDFTIE